LIIRIERPDQHQAGYELGNPVSPFQRLGHPVVCFLAYIPGFRLCVRRIDLLRAQALVVRVAFHRQRLREVVGNGLGQMNFLGQLSCPLS
jgi:hypothetical protein